MIHNTINQLLKKLKDDYPSTGQLFQQLSNALAHQATGGAGTPVYPNHNGTCTGTNDVCNNGSCPGSVNRVCTNASCEPPGGGGNQACIPGTETGGGF